MERLTEEELAKLEAVSDRDEWNEICKEIKEAHGGYYPEDWWVKVLGSGLAERKIGVRYERVH
jgi:hypothetical protein